ncbi:hypothetical protein D3C73_1399540 [compost metagenome]
MGIGMSYVKRMIENQHGSLASQEIYSQLGKGTTVYLKLPSMEAGISRGTQGGFIAYRSGHACHVGYGANADRTEAMSPYLYRGADASSGFRIYPGLPEAGGY